MIFTPLLCRSVNPDVVEPFRDRYDSVRLCGGGPQGFSTRYTRIRTTPMAQNL